MSIRTLHVQYVGNNLHIHDWHERDVAAITTNDGREWVPIVRCRDCKWFTPEYFYEEERGYGVKEILSDPPDCGNPERCSHHYDRLTKKTVPVHIVTDPDGFCAWGVKRKEDGE